MRDSAREQFSTVAKQFIELGLQSGCGTEIDLTRSITRGWHWYEHAIYSHLGCMERVVSIKAASAPTASECSADLELEFEDNIHGGDDSAEGSVDHSGQLLMRQYVTWSATYQIPIFCFSMHDTGGSPVSLDRIYASAFFAKSRGMVGPAPEAGSTALFERASASPNTIATPAPTAFPVIAQGDHPVLGTPCWVFHPCETSAAIQEVLDEIIGDNWTDSDADFLKWLETWFMILSGVVDLRE